jgi:hypothetical protein
VESPLYSGSPDDNETFLRARCQQFDGIHRALAAGTLSLCPEVRAIDYAQQILRSQPTGTVSPETARRFTAASRQVGFLLLTQSATPTTD